MEKAWAMSPIEGDQIMPQASEALRALFESDYDAVLVIEAAGLKETKGMISGTIDASLSDEAKTHVWAAVAYLMDEWDFDFRHDDPK